jgi:2-polyprenyl-3-methyl-5-hydroxy-6-metoxy-1,4-benzoquinol methylase
MNLATVILEQLPNHARDLLDIGCGDGSLTSELAKKAESILAIDIDRRSIEQARSRFRGFSGLEFRVGDASHLEDILRGAQFDCIVSVLAMHHLNATHVMQVMRTHLKENGRIVIVDLYANSKGTFIGYLLDQLLFSQIYEISALFGTMRKAGIIKTLSFLLWRFKFAISPKGFRHLRKDFMGRMPPSLQEWRAILQEKLPHGSERIIMGSVLMYSWTHQ